MDATLLAIGLSLLTAPADRAATVSQQHPLRVVLPSGPNVYDPHLDPTVAGSAIFGNVFQSLVSFDDEGRLEPLLATAWEHEDGRTWRFHLRDGVRFHDGSELDATDVVASVERARTHPESAQKQALASIAIVAAEGPKTVRIDLATTDALLLIKLAGTEILPETAGQTLDQTIGSGPYRLVHVAEDAVRLEAFDRYWGRKPSTEVVEVSISSDFAENVDRLREDEADLVVGLPTSLVDVVEADPELWVDSVVGGTVTFLALNATKPPFSDPLFREAVDAALDRAAISETVYKNFARPIYQMLTDRVFGFHPKLAAPPRDLDRARALLAATSVPKTFRIHHLGTADNRALMEAIAAQLGEVGIRVETEEQPWSSLWDRATGGALEAILLSWSAAKGEAGTTFASLIHGNVAPLPLGASDPIIDRQIDASLVETDRGRRLALYHSIAERLAQRRVYLPLSSGLELFAVRSGLRWTPAGRGELDLASVTWDDR